MKVQLKLFYNLIITLAIKIIHYEQQNKVLAQGLIFLGRPQSKITYQKKKVLLNKTLLLRSLLSKEQTLSSPCCLYNSINIFGNTT